MAPNDNVIGAASLAVLLNTAVDGMFVLDRDYRITSVYGGCERITGHSQSELLGSCCRGWADEPPSSAAERPWLRLLSPERDLSGLTTASVSRRSLLQRPDGSKVCVETTHVPMHDSRGEVVCILGVMRRMPDLIRGEHMAGAPAHDLLSHEPVVDSVRSDSERTQETVDDSLDGILQVIEKREILAALRRARGQRAHAARALGISRSRLYRRMEALGIDPREDP